MRLKKISAVGFKSVAAISMVSAVALGQGTKPNEAIRHVVVIFQENVSFDHYFATYPHALDPPGEPDFIALPGTSEIDGLRGTLLYKNPNYLNAVNGAGRAKPFRHSREQAATADQEHNNQPEQMALDHGRMYLFPLSVGRADGPRVPGEKVGVPSTTGLTMGYFDGNTVTATNTLMGHYSDTFEQPGRCVVAPSAERPEVAVVHAEAAILAHCPLRELRTANTVHGSRFYKRWPAATVEPHQP